MAKKTIELDGVHVKVNDQDFVQYQYKHGTIEDYGWDLEFWENMMYVADVDPKHEWMRDPEILNNLGIVFTDGVGVDIDMERGMKYFEKAIAMDDDLARVNLADIYREGKNGIPQDLRRAYKLYKRSGIPLAHYRVGEAFHYGYSVDVDLQQARRYYQLAADEGLDFAREALEELTYQQAD